MRLTVGPHPAAVYWRRRAVVAVGLAIVVLIITYACSGSSSGSSTATPPPVTTTHPSTNRPTTSPPTPKPTTPAPTPTPFSLPNPGANGPCADDEISLTATASPSSVKAGQVSSFTLTVRNISTRSCARDVGGEPQELKLLDATGRVAWSSDDCSTNHSHDVRQLASGQSIPFTLTWDGLRSESGTGAATCGSTAVKVDPGSYQLIARLDEKLSAPVAVNIT